MKRVLYLSFFFFFSACSSDTIDVYDAARQGNLEVIAAEHAKNEKSIDVPNKRGHTPLILACYRDQPEAAKLLIELGADVNYACDLGTALHAVVYKDNLKIAELLLKNDLDINIGDDKKQTALIMAVNGSSPKMVELLLKYKADVTIEDSKGRTAFVYAMMQKNEEIIQLLRK